jgi:hypothetical protein
MQKIDPTRYKDAGVRDGDSSVTVELAVTEDMESKLWSGFMQPFRVRLNFVSH